MLQSLLKGTKKSQAKSQTVRALFPKQTVKMEMSPEKVMNWTFRNK